LSGKRPPCAGARFFGYGLTSLKNWSPELIGSVTAFWLLFKAGVCGTGFQVTAPLRLEVETSRNPAGAVGHDKTTLELDRAIPSFKLKNSNAKA
jgi:hypothetical protein